MKEEKMSRIASRFLALETKVMIKKKIQGKGIIIKEGKTI